MESMKHKLVMTLLVICLIAIAAAIWYMIAVMPDGTQKEGTLVEAVPGWEMMVS
ncbi:hypothetical protein LAD12857_04930 [Lacrimispora amygdalina]|uniref:Uncharacterized protein n=1 Tax=Lacrimispora amygdalina TaxID=253257 RepID=A0ABQ5M0V8_9FIRM|nr:hypothetical protein [Clostridium indicum]